MKWIINKIDDKIIQELQETRNLTKIQATLLANRGITKENAKKYIDGDLSYLYDLNLIKDIDKGADIIVESINNREKITIFGDYDVDGITATALMLRALKYLDADVDYYLPHRIDEGYGMNEKAIKNLKKRGTNLIITVDNGIAAVNEIKLAKNLGIKVVVTDHHDCPDILPKADALINPKQKDDKYPNKDLCGCAIAWRVIEKVFYKLKQNVDYIYDLLSLVAIATVSDMMDLTDENRILVKEGLLAINENTNLGISTLMETINLDEVVAENIAFKIGPILNADGRLDNAEHSLRLLISDDYEECKKLSLYLNEINEKRKALTAKYVEEAEKFIEINNLKNNNVLVIFNSDFPEGLVGLIASKIKEKYQVPTFVFTEGDKYYKCSGRGVEGHPLNLFDAINNAKKYWVKGGGHKMACGLSMIKDIDNLKAFSRNLNEQADKLLKQKPFEPYLIVDYIENNPTEEFCREVSILEPTGKGNPKAVIMAKDVAIQPPVKFVGDGTHIAFNFTKDRKGIAFGMSHVYQELNSPSHLDIVYSPNIDVFSFKNHLDEVITIRTVKMYIQDFNCSQKFKNKSLLISSFK